MGGKSKPAPTPAVVPATKVTTTPSAETNAASTAEAKKRSTLGAVAETKGTTSDYAGTVLGS